MSRCTCYVRGTHDEKPRKKIVPHKVVRLRDGQTIYLPPVETDDPKCPIHGLAGSKIKRLVGAT
jgi:hypothetical protein